MECLEHSDVETCLVSSEHFPGKCCSMFHIQCSNITVVAADMSHHNVCVNNDYLNF